MKLVIAKRRMCLYIFIIKSLNLDKTKRNEQAHMSRSVIYRLHPKVKQLQSVDSYLKNQSLYVQIKKYLLSLLMEGHPYLLIRRKSFNMNSVLSKPLHSQEALRYLKIILQWTLQTRITFINYLTSRTYLHNQWGYLQRKIALVWLDSC